MTLDQLKQFAHQGKLILHKYNVGKFTRNKYVYYETQNPDDSNYYEIKEIKKIPFTRYYYSARTSDMPDHKSYKITAGDYKELLTNGAKEECSGKSQSANQINFFGNTL